VASPQIENGYTKIANEIMEKLSAYRISGREWQILLVIIRRTYGFNKKSDYISMGQFSKFTGMKRPDVAEQIKKLLGKNLIGVTQNPNSNGINSYIFQKDWQLWKALPKKLTVTQNPNTLLPKTLTKGVTQNPTHKRNNTKETITKEKERLIFPEGIDQKTWDDYLSMRKQIRKPATEQAKRLILLDLEKFKGQGHDPNDVLKQSIKNSWQGVFPLKKENKKESIGDGYKYL
jgi:phage replication O-like protein O